MLAGASRDDAAARFSHERGVTALLVPLAIAGGAAGLTLTCASRVLLLEPGLDHALEAQAVARVHRLGQRAPRVRVTRLLVRGTVEECVWRARGASAERDAARAEEQATDEVFAMLAGEEQQGD